MSKLLDLVKKSMWKEVACSFLRIFPNEKKNIQGYEKVFSKLKSLDPSETDMTLYLDLVLKEDDPFSDEDWTHLYFKNGSMCDLSPDKEEIFCMGFSSWSEWLGVEINKETEEKHSPEEIISHCLYEMTFYGFTEKKIKSASDDLKERLDDVKKNPEKCISAEQLFKDIGEKYK